MHEEVAALVGVTWVPVRADAYGIREHREIHGGINNCASLLKELLPSKSVEFLPLSETQRATHWTTVDYLVEVSNKSEGKTKGVFCSRQSTTTTR